MVERPRGQDGPDYTTDGNPIQLADNEDVKEARTEQWIGRAAGGLERGQEGFQNRQKEQEGIGSSGSGGSVRSGGKSIHKG